MKVVVLGSSGMLGRMMVEHLSKNHDVVGLSRKDGMVVSANVDFYTTFSFKIMPHKPDVIVNCIGAIKPTFKGDITERIYTNAIFPRELANIVDAKNSTDELDCELIHITTDCVFSGTNGNYSEIDPHDPLDAYGKSKSLGEPDNCMTIRTSIVGPEWEGNKRSLVEWLLSNRGGEVSGFLNHFWNGVTTLELAKCVDKIIDGDLFEDGVFHVFSNVVDKHELLSLMNEEWDLGIKINETHAPIMCDRTMSTKKDLCGKLSVSDMRTMIAELKPFVEMNRHA